MFTEHWYGLATHTDNYHQRLNVKYMELKKGYFAILMSYLLSYIKSQ